MLFDTWISLEQAAFSAWPALETQQYEGWLLRSANGYTKRANSASAIQLISESNDQQLDEIETFFHARQQPSIFRLASFAVDQSVDEKLIQRGYQFNELSLVMTTDISNVTYQPDTTVEFLDVEEWLELFQQISGKIGNGQATHLRMLQNITSPHACAVIREAGRAVCCGLAAASDGFVGLFDIATSELQVVAHNKAAINLYEGMGFRRAYEYWYRIK